MVEGLKLTIAPEGPPLDVNAIDALKLSMIIVVAAALVWPPGATPTPEGPVMAKSAEPDGVTVSTAGAVWTMLPAVPFSVTG